MKASEAATELGITLSTLRKYALLFEIKNHQFTRDSQNNRYYSPNDLEILRSFVELRKKYPKMTNEEILSELNYNHYLQMEVPLNEKRQDTGVTVVEEIKAIKTEIEALKIEIDNSQQKLTQIYSAVLSINEHIKKQITVKNEIKEPPIKKRKKKGIFF